MSLVEIRLYVTCIHAHLCACVLTNILLTIELQGIVVTFAEELGFAEAKLFPWRQLFLARGAAEAVNVVYLRGERERE